MSDLDETGGARRYESADKLKARHDGLMARRCTLCEGDGDVAAGFGLNAESRHPFITTCPRCGGSGEERTA